MNVEKSTLSINEQFVAYLFSVLELQNGYSSLFILYTIKNTERMSCLLSGMAIFPL